MPELAAGDVIGGEFGDEPRLRRTIFWVLPVQRLLPPGERPLKPVPPFSGSPAGRVGAMRLEKMEKVY